MTDTIEPIPEPKPRRRSKREMRELLVWSFPNAFMAKGVRKKPLMKGIHNQVIEALIKDTRAWQIRDAVDDYCTGPTYQRELLEDVERIDLRGNPAGYVGRESEVHARAQLCRWEKLPLRISTMADGSPIIGAHVLQEDGSIVTTTPTPANSNVNHDYAKAA